MIDEMVVSPFLQSVVASFVIGHMRGRWSFMEHLLLAMGQVSCMDLSQLFIRIRLRRKPIIDSVSTSTSLPCRIL
jgi:hypothetical protein